MTNRKIKFTLNGQRVSIEVRYNCVVTPSAGKRDIDLNVITKPYKTLSICGELAGSAGQNCDTLREMNEEEMDGDIDRLCDMWESYHLNDMNAGTRKQKEVLLGRNMNFEDAQSFLEKADLLVDRGYKYGSAWLVELLDEEDLTELNVILDSLDGADIGEAPDLDDLPDIEGNDIIDSRDVVTRLEGYRAWAKALGFDPDSVDSSVELSDEQENDGVGDNIEELQALREFARQCESYAPDFEFGETIIKDSYFQEYAEDLASDLGAVNKDATWPNNHIDWESAADELKIDYSSVEFKGETYWIR